MGYSSGRKGDEEQEEGETWCGLQSTMGIGMMVEYWYVIGCFSVIVIQGLGRLIPNYFDIEQDKDDNDKYKLIPKDDDLKELIKEKGGVPSSPYRDDVENCLWTLLCNNAPRDEDENKVSAIVTSGCPPPVLSSLSRTYLVI